MRIADGMGMSATPMGLRPSQGKLTVRAEKTGKLATLSISDDQRGEMLLVVVNNSVKELLKYIVEDKT